jgi:hypothetical protein
VRERQRGRGERGTGRSPCHGARDRADAFKARDGICSQRKTRSAQLSMHPALARDEHRPLAPTIETRRELGLSEYIPQYAGGILSPAPHQPHFCSILYV